MALLCPGVATSYLARRLTTADGNVQIATGPENDGLGSGPGCRGRRPIQLDFSDKGAALSIQLEDFIGIGRIVWVFAEARNPQVTSLVEDQSLRPMQVRNTLVRREYIKELEFAGAFIESEAQDISAGRVVKRIRRGYPVEATG